MSKQTLMAVLGGTLALYAARGVDVHLICATRGEVGDVAPDMLKGFNSIAELRESELRCAAGHLGLKAVHFLDYRDSGMPGSPDNRHPQALAAQPLDEVAAKIVCLIRNLKPQIVLTFDPIGGYRHPDHIAIQRATVRAFEQAGNPAFAPESLPAYTPERLYFHVFPKGLLKVGVKLLPLTGKDPHKFGTNGDIDMVSIAEVNFPVHARINVKSVLDKKEQAGACHASQGGGRVGGNLITFFMRRFSATESFMRAYPPVDHRTRIEKDLFAG